MFSTSLDHHHATNSDLFQRRIVPIQTQTTHQKVLPQTKEHMADSSAKGD